jgi:hypothetical protein
VAQVALAGNGVRQRQVVDPNGIRYCYRQNSPHLRVAGGGTRTKQP